MKDNLIIDDLLKQISLKNQNALEELYNLTRGQVFAFALSILKNRSDAEDVMQDTYVNIYKHANMYSSLNKPMTWIFTITKNLCFDKLKNNKKTDNYDLNSLYMIIGSYKDNQFDKLLVKNIVEMLTFEEVQILMLNVLSGFKHREIANMLNLKLSTVLSKYHRAIKKVSSIYKEVKNEAKGN